MNVTATQRADLALPETRPNASAPPPVSPPPLNHPLPTQGEQVQLSNAARQTNPYAGLAPAAVRVQVQAWGSGHNDSLEGILQGQGYSRKEMYRQDGEGRTLIERVVQHNGLRNANLLTAGRQLTVPSKRRQQEQAANPAPAAGAEQRGEAPQSSSRVTVDAWGRGPNSSLEGILRAQGYSTNEIYRKDEQGRTLLDRFAAQNGIATRSRLRAGQTLELPVRTPQAGTPATTPPPVDAPTPQPVTPAPAPAQITAGAPQPQAPNAAPAGEPTGEMGLLLDGVQKNHFTRDEFQALNSMANRYEELRARFGKDGFSNEELKTLGNYERRYGAEFNRLYQSDDTRIVVEAGDPTNPDTRRRLDLHQQGGAIYDGYKGGRLNADEAVQQMMRQRALARQGGAR